MKQTFIIGALEVLVLVLALQLGYDYDSHRSEVKDLNHRIAILDSTLMERDKEIDMLNQSVMQLYYQHEDDDSLMVIFNNQSK